MIGFMKKYYLILCLFILVGCTDENMEPIEEFKVTVFGAGMDCGLWLIDFNPEDKERIEELAGRKGWLKFYAHNLDNSFWQVGIELVVKVRTTRDEELRPCTTLGPGYPWITVVEARKI